MEACSGGVRKRHVCCPSLTCAWTPFLDVAPPSSLFAILEPFGASFYLTCVCATCADTFFRCIFSRKPFCPPSPPACRPFPPIPPLSVLHCLDASMRGHSGGSSCIQAPHDVLKFRAENRLPPCPTECPNAILVSLFNCSCLSVTH